MSESNSVPSKDTTVIKEQFQDLLSNLSSLKSQLTMLSNQVKSLEKNVRKDMKKLQKEAQKNKNKGNRKASGFAVPTKISKDLCKFMNQPDGTEMARTEVTKYIIQYIKDNNLPDSTNKKVIKPDKRLKTLLKINKNDEVTYFNLQKYMNKHFINSKTVSKN